MQLIGILIALCYFYLFIRMITTPEVHEVKELEEPIFCEKCELYYMFEDDYEKALKLFGGVKK